MNDFTVTFPSETIRVILSHLNKSEHLECMLVCTRWHERIPDYVSCLWSHLVIGSKAWPKTNDCLLRCLGPHTRDVCIDDAPTCSVLRKLKDRECGVTVLKLTCYNRFLKDSLELMTAISQFGDTLKDLHITNHTPQDMFEHRLLDSCPNLTHLTLLFRNLGTDTSTSASAIDDADSKRKETKLVYLHIDNELYLKDRATALLRRCPKLESLIMSSRHYPSFYDTHPSIADFNSVFGLCPRLRYVSWNELPIVDNGNPLYQNWKRSAGKAEQSQDIDTRKLNGLVFRGTMEEMVKVTPVLEQSQRTLGYLKLLGLGNDIAPVDGLQFHGLKTLILSGLKMKHDRWMPFLAGCQNLENLTLEAPLNSADLIAVIRGIQYSEHLLRLRLQCTSALSIDDNHSLELFGMLSSSHIQSLCLHDIPITDRGLLDLCDLLSLRELDITTQQYGNRITTAGLLAFAKKLASVSSLLHTLSLAWFASLTDTVLEQLAQVRSLDTLSISYSDQITYAGVDALVGNNKKITTSYCPLLSKGLRRT